MQLSRYEPEITEADEREGAQGTDRGQSYTRYRRAINSYNTTMDKQAFFLTLINAMEHICWNNSVSALLSERFPANRLIRPISRLFGRSIASLETTNCVIPEASSVW